MRLQERGLTVISKAGKINHRVYSQRHLLISLESFFLKTIANSPREVTIELDMALQAIRRAVLGQTRQPPNYPSNPTDTVLPVYYFDDTPLLRNCVQCWTLRFNESLDAEMLRRALSDVLDRPGWRKLGGRIRMNVRTDIILCSESLLTFTRKKKSWKFTFLGSLLRHGLHSNFTMTSTKSI